MSLVLPFDGKIVYSLVNIESSEESIITYLLQVMDTNQQLDGHGQWDVDKRFHSAYNSAGILHIYHVDEQMNNSQ